MAMLKWDQAGERTYETGVDHGVLYVMNAGTYGAGVAWNGLTTVTEKPSGAEASPQYADNIKYLNIIGAESFEASVEAFTYPDEFGVCDGTAEPIPGLKVGQQSRSQFGLSYRTRIGNDLVGDSAGYKIHLVYGAQAGPSERAYATVNDSPEPNTFSWDMTTTPVEVPGMRPTSILTLDSTKISSGNLAQLEAILYGSDAVIAPDGTTTTEATQPRLPLPAEIFTLLGVTTTATV